ncbi:hypothetical protein ACJMK2_034531, partial [Sinanodonta woodiana]
MMFCSWLMIEAVEDTLASGKVNRRSEKDVTGLDFRKLSGARDMRPVQSARHQDRN